MASAVASGLKDKERRTSRQRRLTSSATRSTAPPSIFDQHFGTANIDVNFGNVPPGTKTDATMDSGVFKTLRISRSGQAALAGSGSAPQNNWALSE